MKVLVVDDEPMARKRLARLLGEIEGVEVVALAASGEKALELIDFHDPDLVLLDIEMPGLKGVDAARRPDMPIVIFTTAHSQYAVEAFELGATDYLLKPIRRERLAAALERARALLDDVTRTDLVPDARPQNVRISARDGQRIHLFTAADIARFYALDKYVAFDVDGRQYLMDESLSSLAERLAEHGFARTHRGELVNLARVRWLEVDDGTGVLGLDDGQEARVSRRSLAKLRQLFQA